MDKFHRFMRDESGVTAIEYSMVASATALALAGTMPLLQSALKSQYSGIASGM